jgi:hypothetical protein
MGQGKVPSKSLLCSLCFALLAGGVSATASEKKADDPVPTLRYFLNQPESQIDFARAKLTFDKFSDPSIDVPASLKQIDAMADTARRMAGPNAVALQRLGAVRRLIYVDGIGTATVHFNTT